MASSSGIATRTARGIAWVFGVRGIQKILGVARLVILARLLTPEDFGLMGVVTLSLMAINTVTTLGLASALVREKGDIRGYFDAVWTIQLVRGLVLAFVLYTAAPFVATILGVPDSTPLLRLACLVLVLQSLISGSFVSLRRELEFGKYSLVDLAAALADVGVSIGAALWLRNAWALLLGLLASNFVSCVCTYWVAPYRPRLDFQWAKVRGLWQFGRWFLVSTVLAFALKRGDQFLVAPLLGAAALGYYQAAHRLSDMPAGEYAQLTGVVVFSAFSRLQDDMARLRDGLLALLRLVLLLALPACTCLAVFAEGLVTLLLGDAWRPSAPLIQVLAWHGFAVAVSAGAGPVFLALGKPKILAQLQFAQLTCMIPATWVLIGRFDVWGAAVAVTATGIVFNSAAVVTAMRMVGLSFTRFLRMAAVPVIGAIIIVLVAGALAKWSIPMGGTTAFMVPALVCVVAYVGFLALCEVILDTGHCRFLIAQSAHLGIGGAKADGGERDSRG